ncbi:ATP-dependent endonuclease [Mycobacterium senriense]|nr:ATP-dependent endonuclease [Mycobacterium senriense]
MERYLDAIRSNLLFAKSVILVEGDAEEILIPTLVREVLGVGIDELGISLINIRSTGFQNVAALFHNSRIKRRCSILTDSDTAVIDTDPVSGDDERLKRFREQAKRSAAAGARRMEVLSEFIADNPWLATFYAAHTFEVDLISAGNSTLVSSVVSDVYTDPGTRASAQSAIESGDVAVFGRRVLQMANAMGKGWFAILLGGKVDHTTVIPQYILSALHFAHPRLNVESAYNILKYRLQKFELTESDSQDARDELVECAESFRRREIELADIKIATQRLIPSDSVNTFLEMYCSCE